MSRQFRATAAGLLVFAGIFSLPLLGALLRAEHPLSFYFQFPPEIVKTFPGLTPWFAGLVLLLAAAYLTPFVWPQLLGFRVAPKTTAKMPPAGRFPWWGWMGLSLIALFWTISWTPLSGLELVRDRAFSPLWLGYVLTMDGLVFRKKGHSLASRSWIRFAAMFLASAILWWSFEYINRFVQNWYYLARQEYSTWEYLLWATPSFSTVLPALLETAEWIGAHQWVNRRFREGPPWRSVHRVAWLLLGVGAVGMVLMGFYPEFFYPFAWVGPLFGLMPVVHFFAPNNSILTRIARGDFRELVALSLAGPFCGFFWEMWNFFSFPKWQYQVPHVMFGQIFEMPVLGYFGYLPFGWECLLIWQCWLLVFGRAEDGVRIIRQPSTPVARKHADPAAANPDRRLVSSNC